MAIKDTIKQTAKQTAKSVFRVNFKTFFNPRSWLGYDLLAQQTRVLINLFKSIYFIPPSNETETFEQSVQRQNLTEADIEKTKLNYFLYSIFFVLFGLVTLSYSFYLLLEYHALIGCLISMTLAVLCLTQAFYYHFWYFQLESRKLGCTFVEWRQGKISNHEEPKP